jgi:hypothetical protein
MEFLFVARISPSHLPNIFAMIKIRNAPPSPPPRRRYSRENPIAANMGVKVIIIIIRIKVGILGKRAGFRMPFRLG